MKYAICNEIPSKNWRLPDTCKVDYTLQLQALT